ncbi:MAG: tetratricopeptide repeat protein, partial [Gemmatimonadota bacterium]
MPPPSLWDRLRKARVVQVLLVYLGASWIVLQIIETLMGLLTLPSWVGPVALLLLLVGLFVVLATAWVQALPQTTAREEAGEIPTDWQVAPADVLASLKKGRLPHLTWGRAIVGGLVALSLLVGAAGGYVLLGGSGGLLGPSEAGAEDSASGIAVLPFHVAGPSLDLYREGMVDLMSSNLDGLSGYRAVDARTVLARWKRDVGEGNEAEMDEALRVAAGTGARYAVVGSGVELGARIRFTADLYDLATGDKVGSGQAEGDPDDVLSLVDGLTVEVMRSLLDATGQGSAGQDLRLASLLTRSVPALRDYLQGDALFRKGRFAEAREALERAVQEDSTFALAHWRLGEAIGWITGIGDREGQEHKRLAARYGDRLPPREATLLAVSSAISRGRAMEELETLETYLRRYPDDPDGWYNLGEMALHAQQATGIADDRVEEALYKAVELDPTFSPYYLHALEWASAKGERERFDSLMAGWERAGEEEAGLTSFRIRGDLLFGDEEQRAAAAEELGSLD